MHGNAEKIPSDLARVQLSSAFARWQSPAATKSKLTASWTHLSDCRANPPRMKTGSSLIQKTLIRLCSHYFRGDSADSSTGDTSDDHSDNEDDGIPTVPSLDNGRLDLEAGSEGGSGRMTRMFLCNDPTAMRLAFERCKLLDTPSTLEKFLEEACRLMFSDVMQIYSCERPGRKFPFLRCPL